MRSKPQSTWTLEPPLKLQRRLAEMRPEGECAIRLFHRAAQKRGEGRVTPRYLLRFGCCEQSLEIHYDEDHLEINGVHGSLENWREILLPLLRINQSKVRRMPRQALTKPFAATLHGSGGLHVRTHGRGDMVLRERS
jgi:hypothetical protein